MKPPGKTGEMVSEFLLGDNPFIGVSHLAQEKARVRIRLKRKADVIQAALKGGATGFTFSTCEPNLKLIRYLHNSSPSVLASLDYYILTPYAQIYIQEASLAGTPSLFKSLIANITSDPASIPSLASTLLTLNPYKFTALFLKSNLKPYLELLPERKVKAILLHEILTEFILAYKMKSLVEYLSRYVREELGVGFGIETRNIGLVKTRLKGFDEILDYLMTPVNPLGYQMAPNLHSAEKAILETGSEVKIIAVNILASGAITLEEAIRYLKRFKTVLYAVTSATSKPWRAKANFEKLRSELRS